jgi:hypothetical protein
MWHKARIEKSKASEGHPQDSATESGFVQHNVACYLFPDPVKDAMPMEKLEQELLAAVLIKKPKGISEKSTSHQPPMES